MVAYGSGGISHQRKQRQCGGVAYVVAIEAVSNGNINDGVSIIMAIMVTSMA